MGERSGGPAGGTVDRESGAPESVGSDSLARSLFSQESGAAASGGRQGTRFETLFLRHYGRVFGILRRLLGSDEEAEDAAQEVFLRLYRQDSIPTDEAGLSRWLARVATNVGLNILRSDRRQQARLQRTATLDQAEAPGREGRQDPAQAAIAHEETLLVRAALDRMTERARTILVLRNSGLAYAEIADALGIAPGSVGTILARAEREFRRHYEGMENGE
jgi:RNA polymerase sigma-70 factor (ECF subfamily)